MPERHGQGPVDACYGWKILSHFLLLGWPGVLLPIENPGFPAADKKNGPESKLAL